VGTGTRHSGQTPKLSQPHVNIAALILNSMCGACFQIDEPQDDLAVALAGPAHGPHSVGHGRLVWMKRLALIALHGPPCYDLGQRRGDGVIGPIRKGDANHLRALDRGRAVISWRDSVEALGLMGDGVAVPAVRFLAENLLEPPLLTFAL
jgi:hypothetical protein